MVNKISNTQFVSSKQVVTQPKNGEQKQNVHVIQSGESLWSIAQAELGKDAKNNEIYNYVLSIAKANGLDTKKKMNNIKINTQLYLPKRNSNLKNKSTQTQPKNKQSPQLKSVQHKIKTAQNENTKTTNTNPSAKAQKTNPKQLITVNQKVNTQPKKNETEQDFSEIANIFLTDNNLEIENSSLTISDKNQKMYHITQRYKTRNRWLSDSYHERLLMTVNCKNGHISSIAFEGRNDINHDGYDYKLTSNGKDPAKIYTTDILSPKYQGSVSPEVINKIEQRLFSLVKK